MSDVASTFITVTSSTTSSSSPSTSMRYANSLDNLDAVSTSIQQARANSFNNQNFSHYQTGQASGATGQIYSTSGSLRRANPDESQR